MAWLGSTNKKFDGIVRSLQMPRTDSSIEAYIKSRNPNSQDGEQIGEFVYPTQIRRRSLGEVE